MNAPSRGLLRRTPHLGPSGSRNLHLLALDPGGLLQHRHLDLANQRFGHVDPEVRKSSDDLSGAGLHSVFWIALALLLFFVIAHQLSCFQPPSTSLRNSLMERYVRGLRSSFSVNSCPFAVVRRFQTSRRVAMS